jgi:ribosomal protein L35AE/L33A
MKGIIINFHIAYTKEVLVKVQGITDKKKGAKLIGKKAVWKDAKTEHVGHVTGVHGTSGTMKVKFKKPLPATCLAKMIEIRD